MCRLFARVTRVPKPAHSFLLLGDNSFAVQSIEHPDGWGIALCDGDDSELLRSTRPAIADPRFEELSFRGSSRCIIAHIRRATIGAIRQENCHPFMAEHWAFAHNGNVSRFMEQEERIAAEVAPSFLAQRKGETDSELIFLLFLTRLKEQAEGGGTAAVATALRQTVELVREFCGRDPAETVLTCMATNGSELVAIEGGRRLAYRLDPRVDEVVVSSEEIATPSWEDDPGWSELEAGAVLHVSAELEISVL